MTTHEVAIIVLDHIRSLHLGNEFIPPPHFTCPNVSIIQPGQLQKLRQEMAMATLVFEPLVRGMTRLLWFHEIHEIHHSEFRCRCSFSADFPKKLNSLWRTIWTTILRTVWRIYIQPLHLKISGFHPFSRPSGFRLGAVHQKGSF